MEATNLNHSFGNFLRPSYIAESNMIDVTKHAKRIGFNFESTLITRRTVKHFKGHQAYLKHAYNEGWIIGNLLALAFRSARKAPHKRCVSFDVCCALTAIKPEDWFQVSPQKITLYASIESSDEFEGGRLVIMLEEEL
ncbi:hypothetical protein ACN08N_00420 (plasmid) [Photobacterium leiognathi subsp. mandapamensis]|uniref:hypothetical protein n=1 Tax=Photobacterium leiognathi TaxID=553611 RepID=UPI003AF37C8F